jgi:DNA-binding NtrC family response regulator
MDNSKEMKVLLVDDEERFRHALARQLSVRGFTVFEADCGEDGVSVTGKEMPDVVILDQEMPGMKGTEAFVEIKRIHPSVEVIMLTGHATMDTALSIMKKGAFDYLMKPLNIDELLYKVEDAYTRKMLNDKRNQVPGPNKAGTV